MTIADMKSELSSLLAQKRGGAMTQSGGQSLKLTPIVVGGGAAVMFAAGAMMLIPKGGTPKPVAVNPQDTAQQEMALQFMARQQAINEKLLIGQQELSAQMIEAQSKSKPVQPNINCFLAICPGTGQSETPSDDFAVIGQGIQTAKVDPSSVLPQLQQQVPQQAPPIRPQQPIENYSEVQQVSAVRPDAAERAYRALSRELVERPQTFYNVAWAWRNHLHSDNPTAQALRRIFKENPGSAPYAY